MTAILNLFAETIAILLTLLQVNNGLNTPDLPKPHYQVVATRFGDVNDKWVGGNLTCDSDRRVQPDDHICAHRYMAAKYGCGTTLILENPRTKKRSWCTVMDSGPFGAEVYTKGGSGKYNVPVFVDGKHAWYVKIRRSDRPPDSKCPTGDCIGRWRAGLDISPAASSELGHNGMERINAWRSDRLDEQLLLSRKRKDRLQVFLPDKKPHDRVSLLWVR